VLLTKARMDVVTTAPPALPPDAGVAAGVSSPVTSPLPTDEPPLLHTEAPQPGQGSVALPTKKGSDTEDEDPEERAGDDQQAAATDERPTAAKKKRKSSVGAATEVDERVRAVGALVWAKLGSFPFWPAVVVDKSAVNPKLVKRTSSPTAVLVRFFGSYDWAWVQPTRMMVYEDKTEHLAKGCKQKLFKAALKEVSDFIAHETIPSGWMHADRQALGVDANDGAGKRRRSEDGHEEQVLVARCTCMNVQMRQNA